MRNTRIDQILTLIDAALDENAAAGRWSSFRSTSSTRVIPQEDPTRRT